MADDENQQLFSLRWHNHQNLVMEALGGMLHSGRWADVTLSAGGRTMKAHRLVLAACSRYFADLFKETEELGPPLVVVAGCGARELRLLLRLLYTGQVTAPRDAVRPLLRLAAALHVTGLTECNTNMPDTNEFEIKCEYETNKRLSDTEFTQPLSKRRYLNPNNAKYFADNHSLDEDGGISQQEQVLEIKENYPENEPEQVNEIPTITYDVMHNLWRANGVINDNKVVKNTKNRPNFKLVKGYIEKKLEKSGKLDRIVENLYNCRSATQNAKETEHGKLHIDLSNTQENSTETTPHQPKSPPTVFSDKKPRTVQAGTGGASVAGGAICSVCNKRLSNQYNLRVHMETHAGTRHACSSCTHISRSKDALRKHVAYRHPNVKITGRPHF